MESVVINIKAEYATPNCKHIKSRKLPIIVKTAHRFKQDLDFVNIDKYINWKDILEPNRFNKFRTNCLLPFNLTYEAEQEQLREYRPTVTNNWGNSYTG